MKTVTFVTANEVKFLAARHAAETYGFIVEQSKLDFAEMQGEGKEIAQSKVRQAYEALERAVVVTDDVWVIPGLGGFPGPYMRQMNEWFTPEDWLRLTSTLEDRTITLQRHICYKDDAIEKYFVENIDALLLKQIQGVHKYAHLTITSFDGGTYSRAETLAHDSSPVETSTVNAWQQFAEWFVSNNA